MFIHVSILQVIRARNNYYTIEFYFLAGRTNDQFNVWSGLSAVCENADDRARKGSKRRRARVS